MNNTVVLYKTKYTLTSYEQPYFLTTQTRDSYLSGCSPYTVPLVQPNIKFGINLDLELVIPIDYTIAQDYNFVKITYNSKDYYAYIVDMELVSVGNVRAYMHRAVLFENPNYLANFKNFNISKATFTSGYSYNRNTAFFKPDFRYYSTYNAINNLSMKMKINGTEKTLPFKKLRNFLILYMRDTFSITPQNPNNTAFYPYFGCTIYGFESQYNIFAIPLRDEEDSYNEPVKLVSTAGTSLLTSFEKLSVPREKIIDSISPNVSTFHYIKMPVFKDGDYEVFPFYCNRGSASNTFSWWVREGTRNEEGVENCQYKYGVLIDSLSYDYHGINDIEFSFSITPQNPFGEIEIKLYSVAGSFRIDKSNILDGNSFTIKFKQYISQNSFTIFYEILTNGNSVFQSKVERGYIDTSTSISFTVDSEASFNAENAYYDEMTANVKREKITRGWIQTGENALLAVSQSFGASKMIGNDSLGLQTAGISNAIRAIGTIADTYVAADHYEQQRKIAKKNEQAKPDQTMLASDAYATIGEFSEYYYIEEIPFTEDYEEWQSNTKIFGIECNLFETSIDLSSKIVDNNFFLQAVATMANTAKLDQPTFSELFKLLTSGCVYNYFQT